MSTEETVGILDEEFRIDESAGVDLAFETPATNFVKPVQYSLDDKFRFNCHKGIACFNKCCKNIDVPLTPYDILRLKKQIGISSRQFVSRYTVPFEMNTQGMPGLHLTHKAGTSECIFMTEQGCSVYANRPTACRYYALGNIGIRKKPGKKPSNSYFIIKDNFCLGHNEAETQTIREYLHNQGAAHYDQYNEDWRDIIFKKRSGSSVFGKAGERSIQLFDMCSYDIDSFREYIQGSGFLNLFDISQQTLAILLNNDEELLLFAMRFLKQILFGEKTIPLKLDAQQKLRQVKMDIPVIKHEAQSLSRRSADALEDCVDS